MTYHTADRSADLRPPAGLAHSCLPVHKVTSLFPEIPLRASATHTHTTVTNNLHHGHVREVSCTCQPIPLSWANHCMNRAEAKKGKERSWHSRAGEQRDPASLGPGSKTVDNTSTLKPAALIPEGSNRLHSHRYEHMSSGYCRKTTGTRRGREAQIQLYQASSCQ